MIPRSTSVIARRLPPSRPGKGTAAIYVAGVDDGSSRSSSHKMGAGSAGGSSARGGFSTGGGRGGFGGAAGGMHMQKRFDGRDDKVRL